MTRAIDGQAFERWISTWMWAVINLLQLDTSSSASNSLNVIGAQCHDLLMTGKSDQFWWLYGFVCGSNRAVQILDRLLARRTSKWPIFSFSILGMWLIKFLPLHSFTKSNMPSRLSPELESPRLLLEERTLRSSSLSEKYPWVLQLDSWTLKPRHWNTASKPR
jgi:hypothetical protein